MNEIGAMHFLEQNIVKKRQQDRNEIGAMQFF